MLTKICCRITMLTIIGCRIKMLTIICCRITMLTIISCRIIMSTIICCRKIMSTIICCRITMLSIVYCRIIMSTIICCRITMLSIVYCRTLTCLALSPMTTDKTPAGSPAVTHRFANKRAGSGDNGEITTQLPAARAGTTWMYIDINKTFPCVYKGFNLLVSCI